MGISPRPNIARIYKIGRVFRENGNVDLDVLSVRADFGDISDVKKDPTSKHDMG